MWIRANCWISQGENSAAHSIKSVPPTFGRQRAQQINLQPKNFF
jgi:hypothetical protein